MLLEFLRDHFGITGERMKREIQLLFSDATRILASKKIDYSGLRNALVPTMDRHEAAFLFDSTEISSSNYGREVFNHLLPLLDPRTTQSILVGDLLGRDQKLVFKILKESMILARSFTFKHGSLLYGVYLNNLTDAMVERLHQELRNFPAYLGYIPTTFSSQAKVYLSTCMAGFLLKKGKTLIMAHEDDRSNTENINITLYDLDQCGYRVSSLQSNYFSIFLTYKIERPVLEGDQADIELALNAISSQAHPLREFDVQLDEAKHGYLINEKLGKMDKAGLAQADRAVIQSIIRAKVNESYIYNLVYRDEHDVMTFNIMVEIGRSNGYPTRMTAALEYLPAKKTLRVITLH